jgi:16S rRNA (guanine(966)-N(2))-methyltransferase RsmD
LPNLEVRPTPDRLRETLFNILSPVIRGAVFVDAYAGSGSVGIEALSRGAARAVFIEKSRAAVEVIQENLASLGLRSRSAVVCGAAPRWLKGEAADIVFLDPPFPEENEYASTMGVLGETPPHVWAIAQHSKRFRMEQCYGKLARVREVRQGENVLGFYRSEQAQLDRSARSDAEEFGGAGLVG